MSQAPTQPEISPAGIYNPKTNQSWIILGGRIRISEGEGSKQGSGKVQGSHGNIRDFTNGSQQGLRALY
jgi:hypothetical protein